MTKQKCKVLVVVYDPDKEEELCKLLREPTKVINNTIGEICNPYDGEQWFVEDLIYELIMRNKFSEGG